MGLLNILLSSTPLGNILIPGLDLAKTGANVGLDLAKTGYGMASTTVDNSFALAVAVKKKPIKRWL
jgi:hypothetical protein